MIDEQARPAAVATGDDVSYTAGFAAIYELIYRLRGKDWPGEAERLLEIVREFRPRAASLLDVACGTGGHLRPLSRLLDHVEGLEIAPEMLAVARRGLPGVALHRGDMRAFDLGREFDAAICMFNSIAYLDDEAQMRAAVAAMARHLVPGGVLIVEPWWFPETFADGRLAADAGHIDGCAIARVSRCTREGRVTRLEARFLVARQSGVEAFSQVSRLRLYTEAEYLDAFAAAGCPARYRPGGLTGRGLFVGVRD